MGVFAKDNISIKKISAIDNAVGMLTKALFIANSSIA